MLFYRSAAWRAVLWADGWMLFVGTPWPSKRSASAIMQPMFARSKPRIDGLVTVRRQHRISAGRSVAGGGRQDRQSCLGEQFPRLFGSPTLADGAVGTEEAFVIKPTAWRDIREGCPLPCGRAHLFAVEGGYSDHVSEADPANGAASMRSSLLTRRWRKADSNSWSHLQAERCTDQHQLVKAAP
jgi:hypothetical protein